MVKSHHVLPKINLRLSRESFYRHQPQMSATSAGKAKRNRTLQTLDYHVNFQRNASTKNSTVMASSIKISDFIRFNQNSHLKSASRKCLTKRLPKPKSMKKFIPS